MYFVILNGTLREHGLQLYLHEYTYKYVSVQDFSLGPGIEK